MVNKPGSKFLYNNLGPYQRLFAPMGIREFNYENNPQGINVGSYGLQPVGSVHSQSYRFILSGDQISMEVPDAFDQKKLIRISGRVQNP